MTPADWALVGGVGLAAFGAGSILFDAAYAGADVRFVGYLVGLFALLAGVGVVLFVSL